MHVVCIHACAPAFLHGLCKQGPCWEQRGTVSAHIHVHIPGHHAAVCTTLRIEPRPCKESHGTASARMVCAARNACIRRCCGSRRCQACVRAADAHVGAGAAALGRLRQQVSTSHVRWEWSCVLVRLLCAEACMAECQISDALRTRGYVGHL
jgi:hypothetical protein